MNAPRSCNPCSRDDANTPRLRTCSRVIARSDSERYNPMDTLLHNESVCYDYKGRGEVSERLKELASKASVGGTLPWVQIPPSPPSFLRCRKSHEIVIRSNPSVGH